MHTTPITLIYADIHTFTMYPINRLWQLLPLFNKYLLMAIYEVIYEYYIKVHVNEHKTHATSG